MQHLFAAALTLAGLTGQSALADEVTDWNQNMFTTNLTDEPGGVFTRTSDALVSLVQGYQDSKRTDRLERIQDVMRIKAKGGKLIFWLRRTLGDWAYHGNKEAEALLGKLPIIEDE